MKLDAKTLIKHKLYKRLWFWVVVFMLLGIIFGSLEPELAKQTKPIIDIFIHTIKILVGPIIFLTVLGGMIGMGNLKQLGTIGIKALIYFEVISTLSLIIGLIFGYVFKPGSGLNLSISSIDPTLVNKYTKNLSTTENLSNILLELIPHNPLRSFYEGNTLQILFMSIVAGVVLFYITEAKRTKILKIIHKAQNYAFKVLSWVMLLSPIAAFASVSFMLGQFGVGVIWHMLGLVGTMIAACIFFILLILGIVAKFIGVNILRFLNLIKDEIILVFATSSSESALGPIMHKLKHVGVEESVVGIVIPAGYSFNLDGTNIYLALVIAFLCQAFNIDLSWQEYFTIILILMATSKGAAGVSGAGFIILAGTLSVMHGKIPVVTISILLGIDKIMSELRSTTNLIGNSIAAVFVAHWEKKLNKKKFNKALSQYSDDIFEYSEEI